MKSNIFLPLIMIGIISCITMENRMSAKNDIHDKQKPYCSEIADPISSLQPFNRICRKNDIIYMEHPIENLPVRFQSLDLYYPDVPSDKKLPLIVYFHGGGWVTNHKSGKREINIGNNIAAAGYVFASVGYELASEKNPTYPKNINQCIESVIFLIKNSAKFGIDNSSYSIMGASAGGHLALMVAFAGNNEKFNRQKFHLSFKSVIDLYGITNLNTRVYSKDDGTPTTRLKDGNSYIYTGVKRNSNPDLWAEASPVNYLRSDIPPILIVHSKDDQTVDINQPKELVGKILSLKQGLQLSDDLTSNKTVYVSSIKKKEIVFIQMLKAGHAFSLDYASDGRMLENIDKVSSLKREVISFLNSTLKGS
ncbi:MAG: alpha/beta hydrolase [Oligoflexales bacterium]|nr:alpha/beta hydrolase [Oligoflexales bacterium]